MSKKLESRNSGTPVGLDNIGNTCFMNSLLQCYFTIPPLVKQVLQAKPTSPDPHCVFLKNLQILFAELIGSIKRSVNPKPVLDSLGKASNTGVGKGSQEDVGEFHMVFVDNLKKALKKCLTSSELQVKRLFNGVITESITLNPSENKEQKVKFCPIIVGNDDGDLISAWENSRFSSISGYRRESGNLVDIVQENWISELPQVLFFQIKRSIYVEGSDEMFKDSSGLHIPAVVYPDRMMAENKEVALKIKQEAKGLIEERNQLFQKLKRFNELSEKSNLFASFQGVIEYISSEFFNEVSGTDKEQGINYVKSLESFANTSKTGIENSIKEISERIDKLYEEVNKTPYVLHSILVHEGADNFGHYFALIKDYNENVWRKYNDSQVTTVPDDQIAKIVNGECDTRVPYCVLYINQQLIEKSATGFPYITYQTDAFSQGVPVNEYILYIQNIELTNFVNNENMNHLRSADSFPALVPDSSRWDLDKSVDRAELIISEFEKKLSSEGNKITNIAKQPFKDIQSFSRFLYFHHAYNLRRLAIMDFVCKELTGERVCNLDQSLKNILLKKAEISNRLLTKDYKEKLESYSMHLRYIKLGSYLLTLLSTFKVHKAVRIFTINFVNQPRLNDSVINLMLETFKYVLFMLISELIITCKSKKLDLIIINCECIHLLHSLYKDYGMVARLDNLFVEIEKKFISSFKSEEKTKFSNAIQQAKSQKMETALVIEKAFSDLIEFNSEFESLDLITFEDNGQILEHYYTLQDAILNTLKKYKKFIERRTNDKELKIKDFE